MSTSPTGSSWDRATLPEGEEKKQAVREMFDAIAPRYDLVNRIMTFRLDVRWRRTTVRDLALPVGSVVLDLASGTGDLCIDLRDAGLVPLSMDLSYGMLAADRSGAPRSQADILRLPVRSGAVDGVTCGFALRNLLELPAFFTELARVVRPGGRIALLDVGVPTNPAIRAGNNVYFGKVVPRIGALLSDGAAYRYLPKSVAYLPEPAEMTEMLRTAGFSDASHRLLSGGLTQQLLGTRDLMRATTLPLDIDLDLNDVARSDGYLFVRDGVGFAGRGVAARVPVDDAVAFLAEIEHDDRVGATPGPIAMGAIPFLPGAPAELVVPEVVVAKAADGRRWITAVDDADADLLATSEPTPTASSYEITPDVAIDHYLAAVAAARDAVRSGQMDKAVIARPISVRADAPIDVHAVLRRLKATFGSSHRFSIDGLIGASPELLVAVDGVEVSAFPLAGTTRTTGDPAVDRRLADELQASPKNQIEHRVTIEMVRDTLLPYCSYLDWSPEPEIVKVANVQHLGSQALGMLSRPAPTVVELVRALQPTPAVGGHPRDRAIELIESVEGFERGRYGGAVGWCDGAGNGRWAVTLRCAELSADRRTARLVAGGGIVADSDPLAELAETQAKFQAMLSAIVRP